MELGERLAAALGAERVEGLARLSGGASRETWRFDAVHADGRVDELVLRRDPPGRPGLPGSMGREAAAIRAAAGAGLAVPELLLATDDPEVWGSAGMVVRRVEGEALARRILRDDEYAGARAGLAAQCGAFLAGLHAVDPGAVPGLVGDDPVEACRVKLDELGEPSPTFELAFRWLEANRPAPTGRSIVHGDFRLGNLMVGPEGLRAVLDWELVHEGDPVDDLGWLCVRCWRFGAPLPVGGFGTREQLLDAYAAAGGATVGPEVLRWWEVLNTLKWGIGCMTQAAAHLDGLVRSVELAAVGRRVCEQEWDLLLLLAPDEVLAGARAAVPAPVADGPGLHGRPTARELLDAVEGYLRDDVLPGTDGRLSYHARVAANVLAIVARELASPPPPYDAAALAAEVRGGAWDGRPDELLVRLAADVPPPLAVANPRYS
jgi:aminoglycoside phosphotransferase (APT) family kinase protein